MGSCITKSNEFGQDLPGPAGKKRCKKKSKKAASPAEGQLINYSLCSRAVDPKNIATANPSNCSHQKTSVAVSDLGMTPLPHPV